MAIRQRLLQTPEDRVTPELAKTVSDFCQPIDVIVSAWVGLHQVSTLNAMAATHLAPNLNLNWSQTPRMSKA